jgi:hypothetical protein
MSLDRLLMLAFVHRRVFERTQRTLGWFACEVAVVRCERAGSGARAWRGHVWVHTGMRTGGPSCGTKGEGYPASWPKAAFTICNSALLDMPETVSPRTPPYKIQDSRCFALPKKNKWFA